MNNKDFTKIAMIAAVYTVISLVLAPISYGNIQVRIAEAFTMLPLIYEPSIWGVTLGCFLTNLIGAMTGANPTGFIDAFVGTLATFLAAECTYKLRNQKIKNVPVWAMLMPVVFNFVFVGIELGVLYFPESVVIGSLICGAEVAVGELISVILGLILVRVFEKNKILEK